MDSMNHTLALSISKISPHLPLQVQSRLGSCGAPASIPGGTKGQRKKGHRESVMKKKFKSWDSKRSALAALAAVILFCVGFASATQVFAQRRLGRPPSGRDLDGTPILAAGTTVIPDGTVLIIEMDTK